MAIFVGFLQILQLRAKTESFLMVNRKSDYERKLDFVYLPVVVDFLRRVFCYTVASTTESRFHDKKYMLRLFGVSGERT